MAILGGGPPVGSANSFTGPSTDFQYILNYAYAYSGIISIDQNATTLLDTTSGSATLRARIDFARVDAESPENNFKVELNGNVVYGLVSGNAPPSSFNDTLDMIIPPYTEFKITAQNITNNDGLSVAVAVTAVAER